MMIRGIFQILPIIITLESAYFLLKSNLFPTSLLLSIKILSAKNINFLKWDFARQSANTWIGILLLLLTVLFQVYNTYDYPTVFEMGNPPLSSLFISIIISIIIFFCCKYLSKKLVNRILSRIEEK